MLVSRLALATAVIAALLASGGVADANCGLDYCPLPTKAAVRPSLGRIQLVVGLVDFSLPEGSGSYVENLVRLEVLRFSNWNFGAWIAPIMLTVNGEEHTGLSNPVAFAERALPVAEQWRLLGGAQLELPMGDSHNGIASGHSELLSYIGAAFDGDAVNVQVRGGVAMALSEGHSHVGGNAVFVNPHADTEAQIRASAIVPLLDGKLQPGAFFNGRMVMGEDVEDRTFLTGALGASYQVTEMARVQGQVEVPLTAAQRFDWRAGVGVALAL